jgi:hypothetical protein
LSRKQGIGVVLGLITLPIGVCVWFFLPSVTEGWARARACEYIQHGGQDLAWQTAGADRWEFPDRGAGARRFETGDATWVLVIAPHNMFDYGYMLGSDGTMYRSSDASGETNLSWGIVREATSYEDLKPLVRPLG